MQPISENAVRYFVDRNIDEGRGARVAFKEADGKKRELTYSDLGLASFQVAGAFATLDVRREERAAFLILDQIELPQLFWGALRAGVIPIPLNTLLSTSIYEMILKDSRASVLFISHELYETVAPAIKQSPWLRHVIVIGGQAPADTISFDAFLAESKPTETVDVSGDETAFWLYSSGSTGEPKGVRHCHGALKATADTYGKHILEITEDDIVYSVAKIFFAYGLGNAMTFPMSVGGTTILFSARPIPAVVFDIIEKEKPTIFCGVPTLYAAMIAHSEKENYWPETNLRVCISAGEALPENVGKNWFQLSGVDILDGVGSTEMLHIFLSNAPNDITYGTSGTPVPGYEVRLVDEANEEVAVGELGELLVKGDSAADGYWNQRKKNRATFEGEWTRTGDKYERDKNGRYTYCGRIDDMFKVSGIWVSPFEIEQAIMSHPAVLEAAVVAKRDKDGLEKPKAFVVLKDGIAPELIDELKEFVKEKIGKWKYPRWIELADNLPKTATGKIQRFKLRGQLR